MLGTGTAVNATRADAGHVVAACHGKEGLARCFSGSKPCFFLGLLDGGRTSVPPRQCLRGRATGKPMRSAGCQPLPHKSAGTPETLAFLVLRRDASSKAVSGEGEVLGGILLVISREGRGRQERLTS